MIEVADGIFQPETECIISSKEIIEKISVMILAANNSVSAYGAVTYLQKTYNLVPDLISGLVVYDQLQLDELRQKVDVPCLKIDEAYHPVLAKAMLRD